MSTLLVGLGSPHGDDRIGWLIAEEIAKRRIPGLMVDRAASPLDLLDRLNATGPSSCDIHSSFFNRLIVCDACELRTSPGTMHHWRWPTDELPSGKPSSTHDMDLPGTLRLAEALGRLPSEVLVVGIEADRFEPATDPSSEMLRAVAEVVTWVVSISALPSLGMIRPVL